MKPFFSSVTDNHEQSVDAYESFACCMAHIDHVLIAVRSAEQYREYLLSRFGLASYHGGRLAGIGTESHIVPLGEGFLDLVSVADEREANSNPLGRAVLAATEEAEAKIISWAVSTGASFQPIVERLELAANPLKRALPDGGHASCRVAGLQQAVEENPLPFFIEWGSKEERPDQVYVDHDCDPLVSASLVLKGFAWLELHGDRERLEGWLDDSMVPLQYAAGPGVDGVEAIGILTEGEAIIIRAPLETRIPTLQPENPETEVLEPVTEEEVPGGECEQLSTFAVVLDSIEQAIETAAVAVETMAGGVTSPRELEVEAEKQS